ncbi:MAG: VOC family protein [Ignavibacteria bacterium]|nr:VOC family protein [Ignavibacteria bacterium]
MESKANALSWFEIPATDIERAGKFYAEIFGVELSPMQEMMGMKMVMFPTDMESGKVGGGLAQSDMHTPSATGTVVYLNANPSVNGVLSKVEAAGGKVAMPTMQISPEIGYMAFFIDTEGNKIGLHANGE